MRLGCRGMRPHCHGTAATSCRGMGAPRSLPNDASVCVLHRQTPLSATAESLYQGMDPLSAIDADERKVAPPTYADTLTGASRHVLLQQLRPGGVLGIDTRCVKQVTQGGRRQWPTKQVPLNLVNTLFKKK